MAHSTEDKQTIQDQHDFIEWLESKGMYNPFAADYVMQFGHKIWIAAGKPKAEK